MSELFVYEKFFRVPAELVEAGDICAVCGIDDIQVQYFLFITHDSYCLLLIVFTNSL